MTISFSTTLASGKTKAKHALVLLLSDDLSLSTQAKALDKKASGLISAAIKASSFTGKKGESLTIPGVNGLTADRVVLIGAGAAKQIDALAFEYAGGNALAALNAAGAKTADMLIDSVKATKLSAAEAAARVGYGAQLRDYHFDKYFTTKKKEDKPSLGTLTVVSKDDKAARKEYGLLSKVANGVHFTRNLVSEPANVIYPDSFAKECKKLEKLGVKVEILTVAQMKKLGMGALLGVGQGSVKESKMAIMQWNGGKKTQKPVAFVGKGVTFDTGGISIKPSQGMDEMKFDMGGAGTVTGLMMALAGRKAKVNAVGVIGLVENMPDGNAQRPGDVVTSMSGQTIEVLNTDAEGRLVLADALWYTQDRFKPQFMINLATLTGAIIVALGSSRAGIFSNNDDLCEKLSKVAEKTGEPLWRLPLGEEYDKQINSDIADMQNIGADREAGSITAGQFLQRFVNNVPWVHIDIAGTAWTKKPNALVPKGATGYGVRLLNQLVADYYEG